ncbi:MAG TPA: UbiD family decarboxylase [Oligoflexia bacterium]|nr:UbiD family decarboxylase [Oligoflexia bacterium]HMP27458.1 UbiD family decarboxylase [Oligoflexia bacterium]
MMTNLGSFIKNLKAEKELIEISAPVSARLEIAEIHRRIIVANGPALLFTNVKDSDFPVVTNLFGTAKRIDLAFNGEPEKVIERLAKLPFELFPPTVSKFWESRDLLKRVFKVGDRQIKSNSGVSANKLAGDQLNKLPFLKTWSQDGGDFLTLPLVYTEDPLTGVGNLGIYRMQRHDSARLGFHAQIGKGGGFHLKRAEQLGKKLPTAVYLGGPPALILAAIAPLPENISELLFASLILGDKLNYVHLADFPYKILNDVEFCLIGEVDPEEFLPEGPFGDHYGFLSLRHDYPVFNCRRILHRDGAVFPATVVGKPRQEDYYLGEYLQKILSPLFPLVMPSVRRLWSYGESGFHSLAAAVVEERYKREALVAGFRILGESQLALTKFLILIDRLIDLIDFQAVLEYVLARVDFRSDLYVFSNLSMDTLDYTGPKVNHGSKAILLGMGEAIRDLPREFIGSVSLPPQIKKAAVFCAGCLLLETEPHTKRNELPAAIAKLKELADWPLIILTDDCVKTSRSQIDFIWGVFTRFEPAADIYSASSDVIRNHIAYQSPIVIDARHKPSYPPELEVDSETKTLVDRRWREYGF